MKTAMLFVSTKFLFNTFCRGERQKSMRVPYCLQGRIPHSDFDLSSASSVDEFITDEVHFSLLFIEKKLRKFLRACYFSLQYNDTNTESFEAKTSIITEVCNFVSMLQVLNMYIESQINSFNEALPPGEKKALFIDTLNMVCVCRKKKLPKTFKVR